MTKKKHEVRKGEKYKKNISNFVFFSEIVELNFSDRIQLRVFEYRIGIRDYFQVHFSQTSTLSR